MTPNPALQDKVILITGATSGIGRVAAQELAAQGATVVLLARDPAKAQRVRDEIVQATQNRKIDILLCDLLSLASIREAATFFKAKYQRLDVLINNAGGIFGKRELSANGYERTFALNQLAYFYLTDQLLDVLRASAPARIVNVASEAARYAKIDWNNLLGERKFNPLNAYAVSKLCNILYSFKLAEELKGTGVSVNCLHPGAVATSFGSSGGSLIKTLALLSKPFMLTPEQGADTLIYLASSPEVEGLTGKFYMHRRAANPPGVAYNYYLQQRLWAACENMVRLALGKDALAYHAVLADVHHQMAQDIGVPIPKPAPEVELELVTVAAEPETVEVKVQKAKPKAKAKSKKTEAPADDQAASPQAATPAAAPAVTQPEATLAAAPTAEGAGDEESSVSYEPIEEGPVDPETAAFNQE